MTSLFSSNRKIFAFTEVFSPLKNLPLIGCVWSVNKNSGKSKCYLIQVKRTFYPSHLLLLATELESL